MPGLTGHLNSVQDAGKHFNGGAYGNGHHNNVGAVHALFNGDQFIGQADSLCGLGGYGIGLNAKDFLGKTPAFKVNCHGTAYKAKADYSNRFL